MKEEKETSVFNFTTIGCIIVFFYISLLSMLYFDDITRDGRLWSVRYEGEHENALFHCFEQWLRNFFAENRDDLESYFKITDLNVAISDTIEDADKLQCLIMDLTPDADLESLFRPLDNRQTVALMLDKEKTRLKNRPVHISWLRLYAIRLEKGSFIITGGAIKLTETMPERTHTFQELAKMEKVRNFLLDENIVDRDKFFTIHFSLFTFFRTFAPMEPKNILGYIAKIVLPFILGGAILWWMYRGEDFSTISHVLMEEMNWTQQKVAEKLGCSQQYVSRMVKGRENLTLEMLSKIEDNLGIPVFGK